jgi:uncharacterized protein YbdZ (MbtH family)
MSMRNEDDDTRQYKVVINYEQQYSIWLVDRAIPKGWKDVGKIGLRSDCLAYIKDAWTDMRPLRLRQRCDENPSSPQAEAGGCSVVNEQVCSGPTSNGLVNLLATGYHPVELRMRGQDPLKALKESIDRQFVYVMFTDTRGGTELGVRLDHSASNIDDANWESGKGKIRLEGSLQLNSISVRCVAEIDLQSLSGTGKLLVSAR